MNCKYFIILFLTVFPANAQKIVEKVWETSGVKTLVVASNVCFEIVMESTDSTSIAVLMETEGEYSEKFALTGERDGAHLYIKTKLNPYFKIPNDKLAAHKVNSVRLRLMVPNSLEVVVNSNDSYFKGTGLFRQLQVNLKNGNCFISEFDGKAQLLSEYGSVEVHCIKNLRVSAISKFGQVYNELGEGSPPELIIETVKGDIRVKKSR